MADIVTELSSLYVKIFDRYYLYARLAPAVLTSIPLYTWYYEAALPIFENAAGLVRWLPLTGSITISVAIVFLLIQINRFLSKEIFQRLYFKDELNMPSTDILLHGNDYFTEQTKGQIRTKIASDFSIEIPDQQAEQINIVNARKQIVLAVSQIRGVLNRSKNVMLRRHNIEYGFFRNLVGGSLLAFIVSVVMIAFYATVKDSRMLQISIIFSVIYIVPISLSKVFISRYGHYYAKILYEQYLLER